LAVDPYIVVLTGFGLVVLLTAWLPMLLKELPLSLPIICVGLGALVFATTDILGDAPQPQRYVKAVERLTEIVVIVSLMGAGLKLDRTLDWRRGLSTWRLLGIAMPLTILAIAVAAYWLLGIGVAAALLLAAALAPTDPVLASDVQVGPPGHGLEDEVRYTLTAEAGLNDGLAFPFVNLAIALAIAAGTGEAWLGHWLAVDVVWKLAAGTGVGWLVGRTLGWMTFKLPNRAKLSRTGDGFVALGITAVAYGVTEMVHGYGFLAVFVAAVTFRSVERGHDYHEKLHDFAEQLERLLMMILLVGFGGAVTAGGLLQGLSWQVLALALIVIFVVRPAAGWISLAGSPHPAGEKAVVAFFGIRGLGSVYYLAYGLGRAPFEKPDLLWGTIGLVILISVFLHGATVTPAMRYLDRRRKRPG
jgi:NhaP-type Na+/H+ or K+/H+ antiporter